jgi:HSP20 family protein
MEIAGIRPQEISLTIEEGVLSIRGQRRDRKPSEDEALHVMEIHYGCFERSFVLPANIDENGAKATYSHGFLEIEIPKGQGCGNQIRIAVEDT